MALMADDPPSPRPRGRSAAVPVAACTTVNSLQLAELCGRVGQAGGTAMAASDRSLPASSRSTRAPPFSDRREAITQPADPPPTTMKS